MYDLFLAEVDILIGYDQYWNVVTGEVRKGTSGPTAINTILGWVLSGPVENHSQQRLQTYQLTYSPLMFCDSKPHPPDQCIAKMTKNSDDSAIWSHLVY